MLETTPAIAATAGLQLAVLGGGVSMPEIPLAVITPAADQRPITRAGTPAGVSAFLPSPVPAAPLVPVHPRKQSRH